MARIGTALIFAIPVIFLLLLMVSFLNEGYFLLVSLMITGVNNSDWDNYDGQCFSNDNTEFCKESFGLVGLNQWLTEKQENVPNYFIDAISNDNTNKTVIIIDGHELKGLT